jgi:hypothetical protein
MQGYLPQANRLVALTVDDGVYRSATAPEQTFVFCRNAEYGACNWLIEAEVGGDVFCLACRHNDTIPDLSDPANLPRFATIERAKKRLFYSLLRLGLPLAQQTEASHNGLLFRFLADMPQAGLRIMTGHEAGIITLSLAEADDAEREARRTGMGEPYRTLLGHFRHEVGHYYWDVLVGAAGNQESFRAVFGDERLDYAQALASHYANGAPLGWADSFISAYASAHPWEDFAETWAHYLHIVDTLETAAAFGLRTRPKTGDAELAARVDFDPYTAPAIGQVIDEWVPVAALTNSLNRSMGTPDAYPFVLSKAVVDKLGYIHALVHARAGQPVPA